MEAEVLVDVQSVKKYYTLGRVTPFKPSICVKAVDGVDISILRGETFGLVGESGCGKSTLGRLILRLDDVSDGKITFEGTDLLSFGKKELRKLRRDMQIIFQDPYSSLNFRRTAREIIEEPLIIHSGDLGKRERERKVLELLNEVGLRPDHLNRYPHEFSGGQRQRIGIARAVALNPKLVICDEPVSALDVSVQAQVLNLLQDLQERHNLAYLFISHDLSVVLHVSNRIAVMYLGRILEQCPSEAIVKNPLHPYTQALLSASPIPDPLRRGNRIILKGDVASPIYPPEGCHFHPRCWKAFEACSKGIPELRQIEPEHYVRCFQCT